MRTQAPRYTDRGEPVEIGGAGAATGWRVQQEARGEWSVYHGGGYVAGPFKYSEGATAWMRRAMADAMEAGELPSNVVRQNLIRRGLDSDILRLVKLARPEVDSLLTNRIHRAVLDALSLTGREPE